MQHYLVIDFDSTFVSSEAFDELAAIVLADDPERDAKVAEIARITTDGMEGRIGFDESLERRIGTLRPGRAHLEQLVRVLKARVTPSVAAERDWLARRAEQVYVISGGFREFIVPVVAEYGIGGDHVLANTFVWGQDGRVASVDPGSPLARDNGKPTVLRGLDLDGPVVMVGDALSDYATREQGAADAFVVFTENVARPGLADKADAVAANFSEVIHLAKTLGRTAFLADPAQI